MSDAAVSVPTAPLATGTDTAPPEAGATANLDRIPTGRQSGQAAPQASNYHWIAAWQVLSTACGAWLFRPFAPWVVRLLALSPPGGFVS